MMVEETRKRENALNRACATLDLSIKNFKASVHQALAHQVGDAVLPAPSGDFHRAGQA